MNKFIIVDIDGTIFRTGTITPIRYAREALNAIKDSGDIMVIYVTGRIFDPTQDIKNAGFPCDMVFYRNTPLMYIPNVAMKQYVIAEMRQVGLSPVAAFDDSTLNIIMYCINNINAIQIKDTDTWKAILQQYKKK